MEVHWRLKINKVPILKVVLYLSSDGATSAVAGAAVGVPLSWEPFYCVLQQDRRILTAYTSEELAVSIFDIIWWNNIFVRVEGECPINLLQIIHK